MLEVFIWPLNSGIFGAPAPFDDDDDVLMPWPNTCRKYIASFNDCPAIFLYFFFIGSSCAVLGPWSLVRCTNTCELMKLAIARFLGLVAPLSLLLAQAGAESLLDEGEVSCGRTVVGRSSGGRGERGGELQTRFLLTYTHLLTTTAAVGSSNLPSPFRGRGIGVC